MQHLQGVKRLSSIIPRIDFPEIFFGFVAPAGVDIAPSIAHFKELFATRGYQVITIKVTDIFKSLQKFIPPEAPLVPAPEYERVSGYISYGNQIRKHFQDDQILALLTILRIMHARRAPTEKPAVYLLHQFKRKEEIELLRSVYGRLFFQISIYSRIGARVDHLARSFAQAESRSDYASFRARAENLVQTDQDEIGNSHGQRVSKFFHDGDIILNADLGPKSLEKQITRFTELVFGSNRISPTKEEYGMFAAKAAALRTLDLSRQVGAAIFSNDGEIVTMGSNEVPKAGGGTYWCDDPKDLDDREYIRRYDSNDRRKKAILAEVLKAIGLEDELNAVLPKLKSTQFMDALEYGRIIHAEMSAICDAARLGRKLSGATLFTTTFPCHMCAKHIVAAGISRVIFLEPYPKSLSSDLHSDSISIEGIDRGKYQDYPSVTFVHFSGVTHRRYRELFERTKRKSEDGDFVEWKDGGKPIIDLKFPFYLSIERLLLDTFEKYLSEFSVAASTFEDILEVEQS